MESRGIFNDPRMEEVDENTNRELGQILSNAGLEMSPESIGKQCAFYADTLDELLGPTPLILAAFQDECCCEHKTKYHGEGYFAHCCGVATLARNFGKTIYSHPLFASLTDASISEADLLYFVS